MRYAVTVDNLGKYFRRYHTSRPKTLMAAALSGLSHMRSFDHFWALRNVSFSVLPGEMLGILGRNGAGKSTLLRLIGGVGRPDAGQIRVHGQIGALLNLGAGFNSALTGRENVVASGLILGLTRKEISRGFDSIVAFSELEEFIDSPVRTYSSGMRMRLAFAVAIHTKPEVLLVDEVLSVGDMKFQAKCLARVKQLKANGTAIILISQNPNQIQTLCDSALWLHHGEVMTHGPADIVSNQYRAHVGDESSVAPAAAPAIQKLAQEQLIIIRNVLILPNSKINSGDSLHIEINYRNIKPVSDPVFSVRICNEMGEICFSNNTKLLELNLPNEQGRGTINLHIKRLDLNAGVYFVDIGIHNQDWSQTYDYHANVYSFEVNSTFQFKGLLNPPCRWQIADNELKRY